MTSSTYPNPNDPEYIEAQKRVRKIKRFYKGLAQWAGTSAFLIALNLFTTGSITWAKYPVFFWGIAILMSVFEVIRLQKHDKDWERREMERQLGKSLPESEYIPLSELPKTKTEDYSEELMQGDRKEREMLDLTEVRKIKKPWKDEDFV